VGQELPLAEPLADEVGTGVERPDSKDEEGDPTAVGAECRQRRAIRQGRRLVAEPQDEPEQRSVEGAEHRREPRRQPVPRVGSGEGPDRGEDRPGRDQQEPARVDGRDDRGIQRERRREHDPEPGEGRIARAGEELEDLAGREDGRDDDHRHDPRPAEQERDDERRDQHRRARGSLTEGSGARRRGAVQRPNRRVRLANSSSAASKASAPKSGHRTSVV
jgi:hypothetical protein